MDSESEKTDCDFLRDAVIRIGKNKGYQHPELYPTRLIQHEKAIQNFESRPLEEIPEQIGGDLV